MNKGGHAHLFIYLNVFFFFLIFTELYFDQNSLLLNVLTQLKRPHDLGILHDETYSEPLAIKFSVFSRNLKKNENVLQGQICKVGDKIY